MTEQDRETLFTKHLAWAQGIGTRLAMAKKQGSFATEEIISAATEGLFEASKTFDPNHKTHAKFPFKRFAYYRVVGTIRDYLRWRSSFKKKRKFNPIIIQLSHEHKKLADDRSDVEKLDQEAVEFIWSMVEKHVWGEPQRVLKMVMRGLTQAEIGKVMGVSESRVSQLIKIARERLKVALKREETCHRPRR